MKNKLIVTSALTLAVFGGVALSQKKSVPVVSSVIHSESQTNHAGPDNIYPPVPGATNPDVTQANISQNICNPHWSTSSIRPPSSYTTALKKKQLDQFGYQDKKLGDYEEDHLISLEIGGNPVDPNNLWPESYTTTPNARDKDKVENYLHKQVCAGAITLQEAQHEVATDWYAVYLTLH